MHSLLCTSCKKFGDCISNRTLEEPINKNIKQGELKREINITYKPNLLLGKMTSDRTSACILYCPT
jgi:hypothetical protein